MIDQEPRPYDPTQDPGNPLSTPPHWSIRWGTIFLVALAAFITALLAVYDVFKTDPFKACLMAAVPAIMAGMNQMNLTNNQTRKELESIKGAKEIGAIKARGMVEVEKLNVEGGE